MPAYPPACRAAKRHYVTKKHGLARVVDGLEWGGTRCVHASLRHRAQHSARTPLQRPSSLTRRCDRLTAHSIATNASGSLLAVAYYTRVCLYQVHMRRGIAAADVLLSSAAAALV